MGFGKSNLNTAYYPDSGETGRPGWFQTYDERTRKWTWGFARFGISQGYFTKFRERRPTALEVAERGARGGLKAGARFRYVHVERWIRVSRGWKARIKYVVEVEIPPYEMVKHRGRGWPICYKKVKFLSTPKARERRPSAVSKAKGHGG